MSRIMIDKRSISSQVTVIGNGQVLMTSHGDELLVVDVAPLCVRVSAKVGKWYQTNTVHAQDGEFLKVHRRYPVALSVLVFVLLCVFWYTHAYDVTRFVTKFIIGLVCDKHLAYAIKSTTSHLVMG